jgi:hypothetical protein
MLAVVSNFKWVHIDYLRALGEHFEIRVAWSGEGGRGAPADGVREGLDAVPIGNVRKEPLEGIRDRLAEEVARFEPDLIHVMYYFHEELVVTVRELVGDAVPVVFECRDPRTTLTGAGPGDEAWVLERDALQAAEAHILVSRALRSYLERSHGLALQPTSLIVPQGFARRNVGPPSPKLSAEDGRVHIALVGTADEHPDEGRWYGEIIRTLVAQGLVVHSHFFELEGRSLEPYRELDRELADYHHHPTVRHRDGTKLSALTSRYDLMGVFHELDAPRHNESATLAVCMPTKAVSGWLHGGMPVVCLPHYGGIVEWIEELEIGFVVPDIASVGRIAADRAAIEAATRRCLACRDQFTYERSAERVRAFVEPLL